MRLYKSSERTEDDLVAHADSAFDPNTGGTISFTADNDSGITGTVYLQYAGDSETITYQPAFNLINFYSDSDRENLVARAGHTSTGTGLTIYEVGSSGISGTIDLDATGDDSDITLTVGYSVGDYVDFETHSLEEGTFQSFFRDNIGQALPSSGSPTISDTLAGGS